MTTVINHINSRIITAVDQIVCFMADTRCCSIFLYENAKDQQYLLTTLFMAINSLCVQDTQRFLTLFSKLFTLNFPCYTFHL